MWWWYAGADSKSLRGRTTRQQQQRDLRWKSQPGVETRKSSGGCFSIFRTSDKQLEKLHLFFCDPLQRPSTCQVEALKEHYEENDGRGQLKLRFHWMNIFFIFYNYILYELFLLCWKVNLVLYVEFSPFEPGLQWWWANGVCRGWWWSLPPPTGSLASQSTFLASIFLPIVSLWLIFNR